MPILSKYPKVRSILLIKRMLSIVCFLSSGDSAIDGVQAAQNGGIHGNALECAVDGGFEKPSPLDCRGKCKVLVNFLIFLGFRGK